MFDILCGHLANLNSKGPQLTSVSVLWNNQFYYMWDRLRRLHTWQWRHVYGQTVNMRSQWFLENSIDANANNISPNKWRWQHRTTKIWIAHTWEIHWYDRLMKYLYFTVIKRQFCSTHMMISEVWQYIIYTTSNQSFHICATLSCITDDIILKTLIYLSGPPTSKSQAET